MLNKSRINHINKIAIGLIASWGFVSCSDIVEEPDITQEQVIIIAPADQTEVKGNVINFTWELVKDANAYLLQVASPDFDQASQVYVDSLISGTSFAKELLPNDYQWRVKAINSAYETLYSYSSFSVRKSDGFEGNTILLSSPVSNFVTNETNIMFSWKPVEGAVEYQIQILDESDTVLSDESIDATGIELTAMEGSFTWRVRALNASKGATLYSSRTMLIDVSKPNTPQLTLPLNKDTESKGAVTFSWEREEILGSIEKDSIYIYSNEDQTNLYKKGVGVEKSFETNMEIGSYFWKVRAFDAAGNISEDSNVYEVTIQ